MEEDSLIGRRLQEVERENSKLRRVVEDTLWMARRYAHNRQSYATALVNISVQTALDLGIDIRPDQTLNEGEHKMFADDAMFGVWNPDTRDFKRTDKS